MAATVEQNTDRPDAKGPIDGPAHRQSREPAEGGRDEFGAEHDEGMSAGREETDEDNEGLEGPAHRQSRDPSEGPRDTNG